MTENEVRLLGAKAMATEIILDVDEPDALEVAVRFDVDLADADLVLDALRKATIRIEWDDDLGADLDDDEDENYLDDGTLYFCEQCQDYH